MQAHAHLAKLADAAAAAAAVSVKADAGLRRAVGVQQQRQKGWRGACHPAVACHGQRGLAVSQVGERR